MEFPSHVTKIITHINPDLDELYGIYLLRTYGKEKFPGIEGASLEVWGKGSDAPDGRSLGHHVEEGALFVGRGGIHFDEHPTATSDRIENACATTLIADYLGIREQPELIQTITYVLKHDTAGGHEHYGLGSLIKILRLFMQADDLYEWLIPVFKLKDTDSLTRDWTRLTLSKDHIDIVRTYLNSLFLKTPQGDKEKALDFVLKRYSASKSPFGLAYLYYGIREKGILSTEEALNWLKQSLYICFEDQVNYHKEVREFGDKSFVVPIQTHRGQVRLVVVESDSRYAVKVGFSRNLGGTADILIVKNPTSGQVQILSNALSRDRFEFIHIAKAIRRAELAWEGVEGKFDDMYLSREGNLKEVPHWFYHISLEALLNGSLSTPDIQATHLPLETIVDTVKRAL